MDLRKFLKKDDQNNRKTPTNSIQKVDIQEEGNVRFIREMDPLDFGKTTCIGVGVIEEKYTIKVTPKKKEDNEIYEGYPALVIIGEDKVVSLEKERKRLYTFVTETLLNVEQRKNLKLFTLQKDS